MKKIYIDSTSEFLMQFFVIFSNWIKKNISLVTTIIIVDSSNNTGQKYSDQLIAYLDVCL